jgi:hypothetical protein
LLSVWNRVGCGYLGGQKLASITRTGWVGAML